MGMNTRIGKRQTKPLLQLFVIGVLQAAWGSPLHAVITWDAENGTHWWFDPVNWDADSNSNGVLPPSNNAAGTSSTDTVISLGTGAWNSGEGVVYDPSSNDPFFEAAASLPFPNGRSRQHINGLLMSLDTAESTKLTIKGDLTFQNSVRVGSASGMRGLATNATIVQESGVVSIPINNLVLAEINTSSVGHGNGTYDYRGGSLEVAQSGGTGMLLSNGSTNAASDLQKAGPAGVGKFIVHNPSSAGHIRIWAVTTAAFAGFDEGILNDPDDSEFDPLFDSDGENTGVGIFEFHYENGGTRPIQINTSMTLNNGVDRNTKGIRSSRLDLMLDAAPCNGTGCVPNNIGLFDIGFDGGGMLLGSGDLNGDGDFFNDKVFSSIDGTKDYYEGDMVSAVFGSTQYSWTISYTGDINWANANDSTISSITGIGTGNDIVLIGHSSGAATTPGDFDNDGDVDGRDFLVWQRGGSPIPLSAGDLSDWQANYGNSSPLAAISAVPEPTGLVLLCVAALPLLGRRR